MKFSFVTFLFTASALADKAETKPGREQIIKNTPNQNIQQTISGQRKLQQQDPMLLPNNKLRGAILSSTTNDVNSKNLTAVIHIGPMKTGSSAIQSSLSSVYDTLRDIDHYEDAVFAMDDGIESYHMLGCFRPDAVPFTGRPGHYELSCHPKALEQVSKVAERNHNLIITAEYLPDPKTDIVALKEFLKPWKNHRIVAYYRRYYDWLLSFHNHIYKQHETPVTRLSVPDFLKEEMDYHYFYDHMYLTEAIERYQAKGFNDIKVINLYDVPNHDAREPFYCSGLVNATATCHAFQEVLKTETPAAENLYLPSSLVYNELAHYAQEMNLWNSEQATNLDVKTVSKIAQEHHNRERKLEEKIGMYEFYNSGAFICPTTEVYTWLLETSLAIEKDLFPEYFHQQGENEIIEHFNLLVQTKKFCHIDAKAVLQNDNEWKSFFQGLVTEK